MVVPKVLFQIPMCLLIEKWWLVHRLCIWASTLNL